MNFERNKQIYQMHFEDGKSVEEIQAYFPELTIPQIHLGMRQHEILKNAENRRALNTIPAKQENFVGLSPRPENVKTMTMRDVFLKANIGALDLSVDAYNRAMKFAGGLSVREIADEECVTYQTIYMQIRGIYKKLKKQLEFELELETDDSSEVVQNIESDDHAYIKLNSNQNRILKKVCSVMDFGTSDKALDFIFHKIEIDLKTFCPDKI